MEQLFTVLPPVKPPDEILAYHVARGQQGGLLVGLTETSAPVESD